MDAVTYDQGTHGMAARRTGDDNEDGPHLWRAIRAAQDSAALALGNAAVHEAKCDGRYMLIEQKLNALLWILGGIAGAGGAALAAYLTKMVIKAA